MQDCVCVVAPCPSRIEPLESVGFVWNRFHATRMATQSTRFLTASGVIYIYIYHKGSCSRLKTQQRDSDRETAVWNQIVDVAVREDLSSSIPRQFSVEPAMEMRKKRFRNPGYEELRLFSTGMRKPWQREPLLHSEWHRSCPVSYPISCPIFITWPSISKIILTFDIGTWMSEQKQRDRSFISL